MKKIAFFLLNFILLFSSQLIAQNEYGIEITEATENRIEFELKKGESDDYRIENVGDLGIVILYNSKDKVESNKKRKIVFTKISTNLTEEYNEEVTVNKGFDIKNHYLEGENLYYFLSNSSDVKKYQLLRFNVNTKETEIIDGELPKKMRISGFWVQKGIVYLVGNAMKSSGIMCLEICGAYATLGCGMFLFNLAQNPFSEPMFVSIDMSEKRPSFGKWTATKKKKKITISSVAVPDSGSRSEILLFEKVKKLNNVYLMSVEDGEYKKASKLAFKSGSQPISLKSHIFSEHEEYITGLYSTTNNAFTSQGIYFGQIEKSKLKNVNTVPFKNLKNYKAIMSTYQSKVVDKKKRKNKQDAVVKLLSYQHDMYKVGEENVLVSEFFYPTYRTETYTTFENGRAVTRTRTVFDGYQYTSALVTAFDNNGKLLWDRALNLTEMPKYMQVRERVKVRGSADNGELTFVYTGSKYNKPKKRYESVIVYATLSGNEFSDKKEVNLFEALETDMMEKKKVEVTTTLEYWHDNYFIAYGIEKSKPNKKESKSKRKKSIAYITRVSF